MSPALGGAETYENPSWEPFLEYLLRTQSYSPVLEMRQIFKLRWGQGDSAIWGLLRSVARNGRWSPKA